jgi:hypothetical protein
MPWYKQSGAFQRRAAVNHQLRWPFARGDGELQLLKAGKRTILGPKPAESGECRFNWVPTAKASKQSDVRLHLDGRAVPEGGGVRPPAQTELSELRHPSGVLRLRRPAGDRVANRRYVLASAGDRAARRQQHAATEDGRYSQGEAQTPQSKLTCHRNYSGNRLINTSCVAAVVCIRPSENTYSRSSDCPTGPVTAKLCVLPWGDPLLACPLGFARKNAVREEGNASAVVDR